MAETSSKVRVERKLRCNKVEWILECFHEMAVNLAVKYVKKHSFYGIGKGDSDTYFYYA